MRHFEIQTGWEGNKPTFHKNTGFAKSPKAASDILALAGFDSSTHPCVAELKRHKGSNTISPKQGECWVFLLNERHYLN